jgi:MinD-like ATPase involved in chromosome partitioning or flagellar assembly
MALQASDRKHNLEVLIRRVALQRSTVIAVVSPKGGPGKTTMTALLGMLFAELRRDPVIALDANPDFGDLKDKLSYDETETALVDSLARWLQANAGASPSDLSRQLGVGPHGLRYVATPRPPEGTALTEMDSGVMQRMIDAADYDLYAWLIRRLRDYAGILLVDCGTGLLDPPVRAALESADQILLVTDTSATTARQVVASARLLPPDIPTWLVANKMAKSSRLDLPQVIASIPRLEGVTVVPVPEGDLAENIVTPNFRWETAPEAWQEPVREIAARLASYWRHMG